MAQYAVGCANFFDNDLVFELVEASSIREAILKHSEVAKDGDDFNSDCPHELEEIKQYFFDMDTLVSAILIPPSVT